MKKYKNIEFVFFVIAGLILLLIIGLIAAFLISQQNFEKEHPHENGEGGMIFLFLIPMFLFTIVTLVWLFILWRVFIKYQKRKYIQLTFIFLFGILPILNLGLHYLLLKANVEHPFTEHIMKWYIQMLMFIFTCGR